MSDPKDQQVARIYRAIALRFYSRYADARDHAEGHGGDLSGYGSRPTQRDADERYAAAGEDMIGEITNDPINEQRDAYHQSRALADVARWINSRIYDELAEQERRKKLERCKLRAVESQDNDDDDPDAA